LPRQDGQPMSPGVIRAPLNQPNDQTDLHDDLHDQLPWYRASGVRSLDNINSLTGGLSESGRITVNQLQTIVPAPNIPQPEIGHLIPSAYVETPTVRLAQPQPVDSQPTIGQLQAQMQTTTADLLATHESAAQSVSGPVPTPAEQLLLNFPLTMPAGIVI